MKIACLLLIIFFSLNIQSQAQNNTYISDQTEPNPSSKIERLSVLLSESSNLLDTYTSYDSIIAKLDEALVLSNELENDTARIRTYNLYGLTSYNRGEYESATEYFYTGTGNS